MRLDGHRHSGRGLVDWLSASFPDHNATQHSFSTQTNERMMDDEDDVSASIGHIQNELELAEAILAPPKPPDVPIPLSPFASPSTFFTHLASLSVFSILGVVIRLAMINLYSYPGSLIPPLFAVQFVGCILLGYFSESKDAVMLKSK